MNLLEFLKWNKYRRVAMPTIQTVTKQLLKAEAVFEQDASCARKRMNPRHPGTMERERAREKDRKTAVKHRGAWNEGCLLILSRVKVGGGTATRSGTNARRQLSDSNWCFEEERS